MLTASCSVVWPQPAHDGIASHIPQVFLGGTSTWPTAARGCMTFRLPSVHCRWLLVMAHPSRCWTVSRDASRGFKHGADTENSLYLWTNEICRRTWAIVDCWFLAWSAQGWRSCSNGPDSQEFEAAPPQTRPERWLWGSPGKTYHWPEEFPIAKGNLIWRVSLCRSNQMFFHRLVLHILISGILSARMGLLVVQILGNIARCHHLEDRNKSRHIPSARDPWTGMTSCQQPTQQMGKVDNNMVARQFQLGVFDILLWSMKQQYP